MPHAIENEEEQMSSGHRPSWWVIAGFVVQVLLAIVAWGGVRYLDAVAEEGRTMRNDLSRTREEAAKDRLDNAATYVRKDDFVRELEKLNKGVEKILEKLEGKADRSSAIGPGLYRETPRATPWRDGRDVNR